MHVPLENNLGHKADFRVKFRFYTKEEGGRQFPPFQGYRSDFYYDHEEHRGTSQIFMIWPEFENEEGLVIIDKEQQIEYSGTARMWIVSPQMRSYHKDKIYVGLNGYFMEGSRHVAECHVIQILDLLINPTEPLVVHGRKY
jgi:hypothetical protein